MEPAEMVERVCNYAAQIITLQKEIMDFKVQHFLRPTCNHSVVDQRIQDLMNDLSEATRMSAAEGTSEEFKADIAAMTRDGYESGEEVRIFLTQLANALTPAAWTALAAPQGQEDNGRKFPHSPHLSGLNQTQWGCLDCSATDRNSTQPCNLSSRTVDIAVCVQLSEGSSLCTDLATCLSGWNSRAGRPTSHCTTPASSFLGPREGGHSRVANLANWTKKQWVLSVLCWRTSYCRRSQLATISSEVYTEDGALRGNERLLPV